MSFRMKRITTSTVKADHVLTALPDTTFFMLDNYLQQKGDEPIQYEDLKAHLLKHFTPSPEERIQEMFDLSNQPLGDQSATAALNELRSLASLPPDAAGEIKTIDFVQALWLKRLPPPVRAQITKINLTDDAVADLAEGHLRAHRASQKSCQVTASSQEETTSNNDENTIAQTKQPYTSHPKKPPPPPPNNQPNYFSRPPSRLPYQPPPSQYRRPPPQYPSHPTSANQQYSAPRIPNGTRGAGYCFYHTRYAQYARNCQKPCTWRGPPPPRYPTAAVGDQAPAVL